MCVYLSDAGNSRRGGDKMKLRRLMFAAPKSGSGKTLITCSILHILKEMGEDVVSYKCGPDYIDPMFHKQVLGISSKNLDTFFTGEEKRKANFKRRYRRIRANKEPTIPKTSPIAASFKSKMAL